MTRTRRLADNLTDYTNDSELDITDGVPHGVGRSSSSLRGTSYFELVNFLFGEVCLLVCFVRRGPVLSFCMLRQNTTKYSLSH